MVHFKPEWAGHQYRRFMRPDAHRWIRPDAHRFLRPDYKRFLAGAEGRGRTAHMGFIMTL